MKDKLDSETNKLACKLWQNRLQRLTDFNTMLAQVNRIITSENDESTLLHSLCHIVVQYAHMQLSWVARPDITGRFQTLAASGEIAYLDDIFITTDPNIPEGCGFLGTTWREERSYYSQSFETTPSIAPWQERNQCFEITAIASLPIHRGQHIWAVLSVYHTEENIFDKELKALLEELALNISRGLDRLDTMSRERQLVAIQKILLDNNVTGIAFLQNRHFVQVNPLFAQILGYDDIKQIIGQSARIIYPNDTECKQVNKLYEDLQNQGSADAFGVHLIKQGGQTIICDLEAGRTNVQGTEIIVLKIQDVTERRELEEKLSRSLDYQHSIFENNAAGIFTVDYDRTITTVNKCTCDMLGYSRDELVGQNAVMIHVNRDIYQSFNSEFIAVRDGDYPKKWDYQLRRKDGTIIWCELMGAKIIHTNGQKGVIWNILDITERHEYENRIHYQAMHDVLTDLPNRRALELELTKAIARASRKGTVLAIGMLDLNDFKPVNDMFGHGAGDRLLKEFTQRLKRQLREMDFLARLGGDEFVLILEGLNETQWLFQLSSMLNRLHEAVETPFVLAHDQTVEVGIGLGMALYPFDGEEGDILLRQADTALYQVKAHKLDRTRWWQRVTETLS